MNVGILEFQKKLIKRIKQTVKNNAIFGKVEI